MAEPLPPVPPALPAPDPTAPPAAPAPATQALYDDGGNRVDVPVDNLGAALATGLGFAPDAKVLVADAQGQVKELDAKGAVNFFSSPEGIGGRGATPLELERQEERETYGGVVGGAGALALGAARGASLGLSDVAIAGLGGEGARKGVAAMEREHDVLSTLGEVGGAIVPALVSGGTSAPESGAALAARGAAGAAAAAERGLVARGGLAALGAVAAPSRAAAALGRAAEGGLVKVIGEESLAARLAAGMAAPLTEGAIEGVGTEIGHAMVDDSPLTADRLLAAGGMGALVGGGAGLGFGLAGEGLRAGGKALGRAVEGGTKLAVEGAEAAGRGAVTLAKDVAGAAATLGGEALEKAPGALGDLGRRGLVAADDLVKGVRGALGEAAEGKAGPILDDLATRKALTATGANKAKLDELAEKGDAAVKRVALLLQEKVPASAGKEGLATMSRAEISAVAKRGREAAGKGIGDWLDELDGVARSLEAKAPAGKVPNVRPNVKRVVKDVEREVLAPLEREVFRGGQAKQLREMLADFAEKADGATLSDVHAMRAKLDDVIFENQVRGARPLEGAYRQMRGRIEDELERTADRIVKYGGRPASEFGEYKRAKQVYADYVWLDEASNAGAWRQASNRSFGLSEQMGLLGGLAFAGAPGAIVGAVVQNLARRYGDQVVATWAYRASRLGAFEAATSIVDDVVGDSLRRFFDMPPTRGLVDAVRPYALRAADGARRAGEAAAAGARSLAGRAREGALEAGRKGGALAARAGEAGARASRDVGRSAARAIESGTEERTSPRDEYRALRARVREARRTLPARAAAQETAPDVRAASPALADRMTDKTISVVDAVHERMASVEPARGATSAWSGSDPVPSDWDAMGVVSFARGAMEPLSVVEDLASGVVDHDAIDGLKVGAPDLYADLQRQAIELAAGNYDRLPYERRVCLGVLLGVPTDDTLEGPFLSSLQGAYAEASAPEPPGPPQGGGAPPNASPNLAASFEPRTTQLQSEI